MSIDRVRTTISLDPEVHEIFKRMAETAGMSVSRCMGEWLADTAEGAQLVALKMQEARNAPMTVMREMQAMSHGLSVEVNNTMATMRKDRVTGSGLRSDTARSPGRSASLAPSSNTGLNTPSLSKGKGKPL